MNNIVIIFMYIDLIVGALAITLGIIAVTCNLFVYFYETCIVGLPEFHRILKFYRNNKDKILKESDIKYEVK